MHCPWPYRSNGREIEAVLAGQFERLTYRANLGSPYPHPVTRAELAVE